VGARVEFLVERLFSLQEPWRGRFLELVADQAGGALLRGRTPAPEDVAAWLRADPALHWQVTQMLNAWQRPGR
jgi:hypothetical protein